MESVSDLIQHLGGPEVVARATGLSLPHCKNLASGRRPLARDTLKALYVAFPDVSSDQWLRLLVRP